MSHGTEITKTEGQEIEQAGQKRVVAPTVDIFENNDEVLVVADVPGATSEGVELNFENNQLIIKAATSLNEQEGTPLFRELEDVDYRRAFELAPGIDAEGTKAELSAGTLTIHLPKSAMHRPRQIPITAS